MTIGEASNARSASSSRSASDLVATACQVNRVKIPAHLDHFPDLWERFELALKALGLDEKVRWQWYLTLLELVNNAITHGSDSDSSRDVVVMWSVNEGDLELSVKDDGTGPHPSLVDDPRLPADVTQQRGRGLCLVHNFSDSWEHWRSEKGYRCVVRKRLPEKTARVSATAPFESVERSVSSLSAFYQLGAAILHQEAPGAFLEKGIEHLVHCYQYRSHAVSVVLSDRLPDEVKTAFGGYAYIRPLEGTPKVVSQVIRGGRGVDWDSGCCQPIVANGMNLGCLLIENAEGVSISMTESAQTRVFADLFGIAIDHYRLRKDQQRDERFRRETEFATRIQSELLLPRGLSPSPHWQIVHHNMTHGLVAGDYQEACYDSEGNLVMAIIDVMGKGATAAIFALMFRTAMHARLQADFDLEGFLTSFNNTLHDWLGGETRFITCTLVKINANRTLVEVVNAGHCPTLVFRQGDLVQQWNASGPPLGVFADSQYPIDQRPYDEVDTLLLVSDGVYEWFEGDQVWGWNNFIDFACRTLSFGHKIFWNTLQDRINQSVDDPATLDDQTLLWWSRRSSSPETETA